MLKKENMPPENSCSECGNGPASSPRLADCGLSFVPREFGYYGGFTDNQPWLGAEDGDWVFLCHYCSLRLLRSFPSIAKSLGSRLHPCDSETPCCEYAWRATENFATNRGETLVRTQHAVLDDKTKYLSWENDEPEMG
jgi:hypothetical protein